MRKQKLYSSIQKEQKELCIEKLCLFMTLIGEDGDHSHPMIYDLVKPIFIQLKILVYHSFISTRAHDQTSEASRDISDFGFHTYIRYEITCYLNLSVDDDMTVIYNHYFRYMTHTVLGALITNAISMRLCIENRTLWRGWNDCMTSYNTCIHFDQYIHHNDTEYRVIEDIIARLKISNPIEAFLEGKT